MTTCFVWITGRPKVTDKHTGDSGLKELSTRTPAHKKVSDDDVLDHVRVYYPSERTIVTSKGGRDVRGCMSKVFGCFA